MNQEEYCRVLYDFKADGHNELSVTKGEVVKLVSAHGEWMMVEKVSKPFQKGFVPTLYITIIKNQSSDNSKVNSLSSSVTSVNEPVSVQPREEKRKNKPPTTNNNNISSSNVSANPTNSKLERLDKITEQAKNQTSPTKQSSTGNTNIHKPQTSQQKQVTIIPEIERSDDSAPIQLSINQMPVINQDITVPKIHETSQPKSNSDLRKSTSSTPSYSKNTQKGTIPKPLSGFVTKVVADYEDSVALMQSYETNEKIFKQTLVQREEAFKSIEQKLDKISKEVLDFQTTNDQLIDKIRRLEMRIENDRSNLINNYTTDVSGITDASERKRNTSRTFQSGSKN